MFFRWKIYMIMSICFHPFALITINKPSISPYVNTSITHQVKRRCITPYKLSNSIWHAKLGADHLFPVLIIILPAHSIGVSRGAPPGARTGHGVPLCGQEGGLGDFPRVPSRHP